MSQAPAVHPAGPRSNLGATDVYSVLQNLPFNHPVRDQEAALEVNWRCPRAGQETSTAL